MNFQKKSIIIPKISSISITKDKLSDSASRKLYKSKPKNNKIVITKKDNDENVNTLNFNNIPIERKVPIKSISTNLIKTNIERSLTKSKIKKEVENVNIHSFRNNDQKNCSFVEIKEIEKNKVIELKENINLAEIENKNYFNENDEESINNYNLRINNELKKDFSSEEYKRFETIFVRELHSKEILQTYLEDENIVKNSLNRHKITERMRTRMVDWMIEVINNYKCDEGSFFLAVNLMDDYFSLYEGTLEPQDLHLIGVTCMFTASKIQDIYPLRLKMVYEKIAHKKIPMEDIKKKESEILSYKKFKISSPTIWDFINLFVEEIFVISDNNYFIESERLVMKSKDYKILKNKKSDLLADIQTSFKFEDIFKSYTKNMLNLLKHVALYLAKMNYHDYNLIVDVKPSLLAAATVFVSLKICEQINKTDYLTDCLIKKLSLLCNKSEGSIIKISQKILNNAQNFDSIFTGLDNLKKVHFNAIIELKNTK